MRVEKTIYDLDEREIRPFNSRNVLTEVLRPAFLKHLATVNLLANRLNISST